MPPSRTPAPALSAPDLIGPTSILSWGPGLAPSRRARRPRVFSHVRLEIDLQPERVREPSLPVLRQIEALLREREVVEIGDVLRLTAQLLHALASEGFTRVDHWEASPGGWLPLPEPSHEGRIEPVGHLERALQSEAWRTLATARSFSVRLSGRAPIRADVTVRRVHRERTASLSLELWGTCPTRTVQEIAGSIRARLPVLRSRVTGFTESASRCRK